MRNLIKQDMGEEEFLFYVGSCLESEFKMKSYIKFEDDKVDFFLSDYKTKFSIEYVKEKKEEGPYSLDRFILDKLVEAGFEFEKERSQYTKYCYEII